MKYLKYVLFSLCMLITLFLSAELITMQNSDYSCFVQMEIHDLIPSDVERRIHTLSDIMQQNELDFFFVGETATEAANTVIDVYFSSAEALEACTFQGKNEGIFKSLISGKTEVVFHEDVMELAKKETLPSRLYQCLTIDRQEIANLPYMSEYLSEHMLSPNHTLPYRLLIRAIWLIMGCILLLLSVIEVFFSRKEVFIRLSYGYDYKYLLLCSLGKEAVGLFISLALPHLLLLPYIPHVGIDKGILMLCFVTLCLDALILASPFYFLDFKSALGKGGTNTKVLFFCYMVRVLLIIVSILILSGAIQRVRNFVTCLQYDRIMKPYQEYLCVRGASAESANWDDRFVLDNIMLLRANNGKDYDVIIANENAKQSLCEILSKEALEDTNAICIYFPDELADCGIDESNLRFLVSLVVEDTDNNKVKSAYYPSDKILEYVTIGTETEDTTHINDELAVQKSFSPVIVYVPEGFSSIYTNVLVYLKENDSQLQSGAFNLYESYLASMNLYRIQAIVLFGIGAVFLVFHYALRKIILNMEHSVNAMELCLKAIHGMGIWERYKKTIAGSAAAHVIGTVLACLFIQRAVGRWLFLIVCTGIGLLAIDIMMELQEISHWERKHMIPILKGGIS